MGPGSFVLPGDPERKHRDKRAREGIPLDDGTWRQLVDAAKQRRVPIPIE